MATWILVVTLSFTTFHSGLDSDLHVVSNATYQKQFESEKECEDSSLKEEMLMMSHFIRFQVSEVNVNHSCILNEEVR